MKLKEEALWAISEIKNQNLLSEEDTSVVFQSWNLLKSNLDHLKDAFEAFNALHCIAIKTNPHIGVLKKIVEYGFGLEAASIEEIELAFSAGIQPSKLVFDSPVKTKLEISRCHSEFKGIILNANSLEELTRIPKKPNFKLGLRLNPLSSSDAPDIYNVSDHESKFGVSINDEKSILNAILKYPISLIHVHIGSSLSDIENSTLALRKVYNLIEKANDLLSENGMERRIDTFDIGGGLKPESVENNSESLMKSYSKMLYQKVPDLKKLKVITEFGQWVHFHAGYCWSIVEYVIRKKNKQILFIHLGADFFLRDAYTHPRALEMLILDKEEKIRTSNLKTDVAGPLCFAGDYVIRDTHLPKTSEGDQLLILGTGSNAYGLWSRHCSRKIPKIIAVDYNKKTIDLLSNRTPINF